MYNTIRMNLESSGILIGIKPFNERDSVARIFTRDFGVLVGMLRGANVAKKNKPLIGQVGNVVWNARLDSQLGVFHWAAEKNLAAPLMVDAVALMRMNAALELLRVLLPERESYDALYDDTLVLMQTLLTDENAYLKWEINLLRGLGYALDLSRCSGCGKTENLNYLSPRTGRAVCDVCAAPYINKLYKLPLNLDVTGRFVDAVCVGQGTQMPVMRKMLK